MRILQILPTLDAGGAEGFISQLSIELKNLNHEVNIFLTAGVRPGRGELLAQELTQAGVKIIGMQPRSIKSLRNLSTLYWEIINFNPDIIQSNLRSSDVYASAIKKALPYTKKIFVRRIASTKNFTAQNRIIKNLVDKTFDLTVCCSEPVSKIFLETEEKQKKLNHRTTIIRNGVSFQMQKSYYEHEKERIETRRRLGINSSATIVAHIGRMTGTYCQSENSFYNNPKAHDIVIRSFSKAFQNQKDILLLLAGDGPLKNHFKELAKKENILNKTIFLGKTNSPWEVLNASDIFLFPSRHEGMPNSIPEAASCGLPIVASNIPEIKALDRDIEMILESPDNVTAFAEALRTTLSNLDCYKNISKNNIPHVLESFSMRSCAQTYLTEYKRTLYDRNVSSPFE